jgi:hypothetical protein
MAIIGRVSQYASFVVSNEFNEIGVTTVGIDSTGTYRANGLSENIVDIVREGLVLNLDAGNSSSYPGYGTIWTDLSGLGNNGALQNGVGYTSANGGSIVFDGTNDWVDGTSTTIPITNAITVSAWIKHNTLTDTVQRYVSTLGTLGEVAVIRNSGASSVGQLHFYIRTDGTLKTNLRVDNSLEPNTWYYVVGTWDGTTSRLYKNGVEVGIDTPGGTLNGGNLNYTLSSPTETMNGYIPQVSVYNRVLSAAEIQKNYNALSGRYGLLTTQQISLNTFSPYDLIYDEFASTLYGSGKGTYIKQYSDGNLVVYNELDEVGLTPTTVFTPSTYLINEGGTINFSIVTTNIEDNIPLYYEMVTPSPTGLITQSTTSFSSGNSISFNATTLNINSGTILTYDIVGNILSSDFTDNSLTGITTVTAGIIDTITKTTTGAGNKTFALNLRSGGNIIATSATINLKPPALYEFTSFTFTNATAEGTYGPTLANLQSEYSSQSWANNISYLNLFNSTRGYQYWAVPSDGTFRLTAAGAQGGAGRWGSYYGAFGAKMQATISLLKGDYLIFVVGQRGGYENSGSNGSSGGGGGTFIFKNNLLTPILIAGGGGGSGGNTSPVAGKSGETTNNGGSNTYGNIGGSDGAGAPSYSGGGGGAGLTGNGGVGAEAAAGGLNIKTGGGTGGRGGSCSTSQTGIKNFNSFGQDQGGFGGGGGGEWCIQGGVGGGGGYSGGAGNTTSVGAAGGGGSYVNPSFAILIGTSNGTYNDTGNYAVIGYNGSALLGTIFSNSMGYVLVEKI